MKKLDSIQRRRLNLWTIDPHCHWCGIKTVDPIGPPNGVLKPESATLDHLYSRLNPERRKVEDRKEERTVLSCYKCNHRRGAKEDREYRESLKDVLEERSWLNITSSV